MKEKLTKSQEYYRRNKSREAETNREYYKKNRERIRAQQRDYYIKNKARLNKSCSENYYKNWKLIRERQARYYQTYKDIINKRNIEYLRRNPKARVIKNLRRRPGSVINGRTSGTMEFIGCDREHLLRHLEVQFTPRMTWDNYGKVWVVDHHIPINAFNHDNSREASACWHFSNLKPMGIKENMSKGDTICLER